MGKQKKDLAIIYRDPDTGFYKIKDMYDVVWFDEFLTEEEATTYALREGCKVEGC